ncbi:Hypothetical protein ORPV_855 [Orpheovirus IHUMI-LCC2]|uniref:Uncharacterized protein n=1 Tax=Orpheovirus IHUMI-LCC2 TaxID=2023057 RepID=A0A2I2L5M7_9VIRU|nr:Hypothetical protein ORPV_855 [Orpheovirus IHUMI-LCC2]SNW62759.1 Hypothetical protein ORPV_855 [Orpheovirus IHUMI-LCC2]
MGTILSRNLSSSILNEKRSHGTIFPNLPIELNTVILNYLAPQDISALCNVISTSNDLNISNCQNIIINYYGRTGLNIIKKLTLQEFILLNNLIWPVPETLDITKITSPLLLNGASMNIIKRAFVIKYNNVEIQEMIRKYESKLNRNNYEIINLINMVDEIIFKYNRGDIKELHYETGVYPYIPSFLENGGNPELVLTRYTSKSTYMYNEQVFIEIYDLIHMILSCTFPNLAFNKVKPYFLGSNVNFTHEFLKYVYTGPLYDVHNKILNSHDIISDNEKLGEAIFVAYTQRDDRDAIFSGYLLKYALEFYTFVEIIRYAICLNDINLYKIAYNLRYKPNLTSSSMRNINIDTIKLEPIDPVLISELYEENNETFLHMLCEFMSNNYENFDSLDSRFYYGRHGGKISENMNPVCLYTIGCFSTPEKASESLKQSLSVVTL